MHGKRPAVVTLFVFHEVVTASDGPDGLEENGWLDSHGTHPVENIIVIVPLNDVNTSSRRLVGSIELLTHELQEWFHVELACLMNIRPHWYLLSQTVLKQGIVLLWQGAVEDFSINPTTDVQANVLGIDIIVHFAGKSYYDTFTSMHIGHNTYF